MSIRSAQVVSLMVWTPVLIANALCCWWLYSFARLGAFLPDVHTLLRIATFVALLSFVWAMSIATIPLYFVWYRRQVRYKRFTAQRCTRCTYCLAGLETRLCPECGTAVVGVHEPRLRSRGIVAAVAMLFCTSLLVMAATELRMRDEERRFDERIRATNGTVHLYTPRAWPNQDAGMAYILGYGLSMHD